MNFKQLRRSEQGVPRNMTAAVFLKQVVPINIGIQWRFRYRLFKKFFDLAIVIPTQKAVIRKIFVYYVYILFVYVLTAYGCT